VITLPVVLLEFKGVMKNGYNELYWKTASETNNHYFTVERSQNGIDFESIGVVLGAGNSNQLLSYMFSDDAPAQDINYYRLKQTDFDGNSSYSETICLRSHDQTGASIVINGNPADESLHLTINTIQDTEALITITDLVGRICHQSSLSLTQGNNDMRLVIDHLPNGFYVLSIQTDHVPKPISEKFIIQHP
jgi:hypothetical protein